MREKAKKKKTSVVSLLSLLSFFGKFIFLFSLKIEMILIRITNKKNQMETPNMQNYEWSSEL